MPFRGSGYAFDQATIATVYEVGAVYGLFKPSARAGWSDCLYVGKTDNLRRRLAEHLSNPPVAGATQFFAEVLAFRTAQSRTRNSFAPRVSATQECRDSCETSLIRGQKSETRISDARRQSSCAYSVQTPWPQ